MPALHMVRLLAIGLASFAAALISGFFYAYYCSVMPGLAATDPLSAIKAMQGINAVVRNAIFAFSFFGTLGFGLLAVIALLGAGRWPFWCAVAGTLIYGAGAFAVTLLVSVPLNEGLARVTPTAASAPEIWRAYVEPWVFWNALRMAMSMLALILFVTGLVALAARPPRS